MPNKQTRLFLRGSRRVLAAALAALWIATLAACGAAAPAAPSETPAPPLASGQVQTAPPSPEPVSPSAPSETPAVPETDKPAGETVSLTLWVGGNYPEVTERLLDRFRAEYEEACGVTFDIRVSVESEGTCKDTVLSDPAAAADVYTFEDDQLFALVNAGALMPLGAYAPAVRASDTAGAVSLAEANGELYAFPLRITFGCFLYYNREYLTEADVESLDRILAVAEANGKSFSLEMTSALYDYGFFAGAGLPLRSSDGVTNDVCGWNAVDTTPTGAQVYQALLDISGRSGFRCLGDADMVAAIQEGSVIAAVNGDWNAAAIRAAWGESFGCARLPAFTAGGRQYQMASFLGGTLIGVNAHTAHPDYALLLADWLSGEESQRLRLEELNDAPVSAALAEEAADPVTAALCAQSLYARKLDVGSSYWVPAAALGRSAAAGVSQDIQGLLDACVAEILG